jgi:hypothetical protein
LLPLVEEGRAFQSLDVELARGNITPVLAEATAITEATRTNTYHDDSNGWLCVAAIN